MSRPKEFDRDVVLARAVATFREWGYEGTSIQLLVDRLGIHRASLYDTYGSKEQLYREALAAYAVEMRGALGPLLTAEGPPLEVLRRFFDRVIDELTSPSGAEGACLMLKAALSGARLLPGVSEQVRRHYDWFGAHFERLVATAREGGDLPGGTDEAELGAYLRQVLLGIVGAAAVDGDSRALGRVLEQQLAVLGGVNPRTARRAQS